MSAGWRVVDVWVDEFADEVPRLVDARLGRQQLVEMSHDEVWEHFLPFLPTHFSAQRTSPTVSMLGEPVHYFRALLAGRPACGARIGFAEESCTYVRSRSTCSGCLSATAVREAA